MYQKQKWRNQIKMCKNTKIENEDIRKIYVEIEVDENKAIEKDLGTIEYLEQEFGWLKESGIKLNSAFIADDEEEPYAAYINYVTDWCFNHSGDDVIRKPLLSYYDWVNDYYKDLNKKYNVKLDTPWCIADYLTKNIGVAPNTTLGNRCSPFYHFYSDNKDVMLSASLEEKKLGLRSDERHYSLYITDNNGTIGEYYTLNSLDVDELEKLLKEILVEIENRSYFRTKHLNEESIFSKLGLRFPDNAMVCDNDKKVVTFNTIQEGCIWMRKHGYKEKDIEKVRPIFTIGRCFHCGDYLFPSFSDNYVCQCFTCDEYFFECEQNELQKSEID